MNEVLITGSLRQIRAKLERMKVVIQNRVTVGYDPLLMAFDYRYSANRDACPECLPLDSLHYRGAYIVSEFENSIQLNSETWAVNKHGHCRCLLRLINAREAVVCLLIEELQAA